MPTGGITNKLPTSDFCAAGRRDDGLASKS